MAVTMEPIISAVSPSFAKEDSYGAGAKLTELRKLNFNQSEEFPHLFSIISAYNRRLHSAAPWNVPPLAIARVASWLLRHCVGHRLFIAQLQL